MIEGINPFTISKIRYRKGRRIGYHPMYNRLMRKKNPIRGMLGCYSEVFLDGYCNPRIEIFGADGSWLKDIPCRSNDDAMKLCAELNAQLAAWVECKRKYE